MVLYAVVEWGTTFSVVSLEVDTLDNGVLNGSHIADCTDPSNAHRIARLLAEDARDRADLTT